MSKTTNYTSRLMRQLTTVMTTADPASKDEGQELLKRISKNKYTSEELLALLILKYAGYKSYCRIIDVVKLKNKLKENSDNSKNVGAIVYNDYNEDTDLYTKEIVIDGTLTLVVIEQMFGVDSQSVNRAIVDPDRLSQISRALSEVAYKKSLVSATVIVEASKEAAAICRGQVIRSYCAGNSRVDVVYLKYDSALGVNVYVHANIGSVDDCK